MHLCWGGQESEKAHFNPTGLVRSLRDWEGQPLDVMVQQDASEFLTQFFQQVSDSTLTTAVYISRWRSNTLHSMYL